MRGVALAALLMAAPLFAQERQRTAATRPRALAGVSARALRLYREAIVVDAHNDLPTKMLDERYDPDVRHAPREGHTDLPRLVESGISGVFLSAYVDPGYAFKTPDESYRRVVAYLDSIHAFVGRHPRQLVFATTAADVRRAKQEGKVAILIGVEGGHAIEASLDRLRELHRRGVRYMTLTHNNGNQWAGAAAGLNGTSTGGLTPFGKDVIREMNRLGMLVDISHVSDSTFFDAVATSTAPVIASHSSARALNDHRRNMSDDMLRALARTGGVVCVNFYAAFLHVPTRDALARLEPAADAQIEALRQRHGKDSDKARRGEAQVRAAVLAKVPPTPLGVLIDHVDHIVKVAGIDHVGLGSDFDGANPMPVGMEDVTRLPRLAQALLDRGYSEEAVRKVLGGNLMRVMQAVLDRREAPNGKGEEQDE